MYNYGYGYEYPYSDYYSDFYSSSGTSDIAIVAVLIVLGILMVVLAASVAMYVLQGFGLYNIGKRRNMNNAFLAFIPVANVYFVGKIADDISATMNKKSNHAQRIIIAYIATIVLEMIFIPLNIATALIANPGSFVLSAVSVMLALVLYAASICTAVFEYIAIYKIFKEYSPNNATLFIVLSIIVPLALPIILFVIRNNKSGYELWLEQRRAERAAAEAMAEWQQKNAPAEERAEVQEIPAQCEEASAAEEEGAEGSFTVEKMPDEPSEETPSESTEE